MLSDSVSTALGSLTTMFFLLRDDDPFASVRSAVVDVMIEPLFEPEIERLESSVALADGVTTVDDSLDVAREFFATSWTTSQHQCRCRWDELLSAHPVLLEPRFWTGENLTVPWAALQGVVCQYSHTIHRHGQ